MELSAIKFDEHGLVPAVAQDAKTGAVLMLAYMNEESLRRTIDTGYATYYSRSRKTLWKKGETSGHVQRVREILYDCDGDTLLLKVVQTGAACHTGAYSCFQNALLAPQETEANPGAKVLQEVYNVVLDRMANPKEGSYTNYLLDKGVEKIAKKVGEEATETVIAAIKNDKDETCYEASDLLYHLLVLLAQRGITLDEIWTELASRR
ncbi:bifunctional phosphoribosyl-AMP cyclohydrolase/phosphoribosyl-ATP diphosphatase HisIE [Beduinella massiliensis]|uniref:bifunctional phosphoribosyl-AMP cyclohydrolase/phosphoribosyl-ATP diphosphatase HisIE n=1 Tax=Beduinella massiliensis TaxID=1852363 RepID=UPI000C8410E7